MTNKSLLIHNPSCSKCRGAKEILEEKGIVFETLEYLNTPLSEELLSSLPALLKMDFPSMLRKNEQIYTELNLKDKNLQPQDWINVLKAHPILLERPIFIHQQKAIIARPPEKVLEIL
jgi:arsenate reductase